MAFGWGKSMVFKRNRRNDMIVFVEYTWHKHAQTKVLEVHKRADSMKNKRLNSIIPLGLKCET